MTNTELDLDVSDVDARFEELTDDELVEVKGGGGLPELSLTHLVGAV